MRAQCYLALNEKKKAFRDFMRVVELKPNNSYAHEQLAKYYRQEGDLNNWKREAALAKRSKSAPKADLVSPEVLTRHDHPVSELLLQANQNLVHKKPGLTLEVCKKMLALTDKDLAVEHINKGEIYDFQAQAFQQMTLNEEAIVALNQVLKFQPTNNRAYYLRAQSYFEIGKYDECLADCDRAASGDKILSNTVAQLRAQAVGRLKRRLERR
jgi:tetratricopeptide (TPR) repeat protein